MKEDGSPAFACAAGEVFLQCGMSLRDYFAGQALAGNFDMPKKLDREKIAELCYKMAETMLEQRKKK